MISLGLIFFVSEYVVKGLNGFGRTSSAVKEELLSINSIVWESKMLFSSIDPRRIVSVPPGICPLHKLTVKYKSHRAAIRFNVQLFYQTYIKFIEMSHYNGFFFNAFEVMDFYIFVGNDE